MNQSLGSLLRGQVAIVTGASSGIGHAISIAMAAAGATVCVNYIGNDVAAKGVVAEIEAAGGAAFALAADVSNEAEVESMLTAVVARCGRLDILVANAGIQRDAPFLDMKIEDWNAALAVDLTGLFLCARSAARQFMKQPLVDGKTTARGKILCISSVHEIIPWAGHVNYAAAKGGVHSFMRSIAQETADMHIRVNSIAPGAIQTEINRSVWSDAEKNRQLMKLIPYGRIGRPEEIANAAVFLCSDFADYITGATLFIDGGMTLYPGFKGNG